MDGLGCFTTLSLHHCAVRKHAVIVNAPFRCSVWYPGCPLSSGSGGLRRSRVVAAQRRTPMSQPDVDVRWQMKQVLKSGRQAPQSVGCRQGDLRVGSPLRRMNKQMQCVGVIRMVRQHALQDADRLERALTGFAVVRPIVPPVEIQ